MRLRSDFKLKLTGIVDFLAMPKHVTTGTNPEVLGVHIIDWKVSKNIEKSNPYNVFGTGSCKDLPDTNFSHYALQLNTYKYLIEHFYKNWVINGKTYKHVKVLRMELIVLHDERCRFEHVLIPDLMPIILKMVQQRREE